MKRFAQVLLLILLIVVIFFFYKDYLNEETKSAYNSKQHTSPGKLNEINKNNLISNLGYEINLSQNKDYKINAKTSEILYQDGIEIIDMKFVKAILTEKNKLPLIITSDAATFNTSKYNSKFEKNVKIKYLNHTIEAENAYVNFDDDIILIKDNVRYIGPMMEMKSDNIKINLVSRDISIFMDNDANEIKVKLEK